MRGNPGIGTGRGGASGTGWSRRNHVADNHPQNSNRCLDQCLFPLFSQLTIGVATCPCVKSPVACKPQTNISHTGWSVHLLSIPPADTLTPPSSHGFVNTDCSTRSLRHTPARNLTSRRRLVVLLPRLAHPIPHALSCPPHLHRSMGSSSHLQPFSCSQRQLAFDTGRLLSPRSQRVEH